MQTIAENTTLVTKKLFRQAMAAAGDYRRLARKSMAVLGALCLVLVLAAAVMGIPMSMVAMELGIVAVAGLWLLVLYPRGRYNKAFRALQQRCDGCMERRLCFYPDHLTVETGGTRTEFSYQEMTKIRTGKNIMVLVTEDKTGVFFALDGFQKGSARTVQDAVEQAMSKECREEK